MDDQNKVLPDFYYMILAVVCLCVFLWTDSMTSLFTLQVFALSKMNIIHHR